MKKLIFISLLAVILTACGDKNKNASEQVQSPDVLVAYFSATGHTEEAAMRLADIIEADIYVIEPEEAYTTEDLNWHDENSRTSYEKNNPDFRPPIKGMVHDLDKYEIIYLGFPIWWASTPPIVHSFLEKNDLSGKTVIPFSTSSGTTTEKAEENLHQTYPTIVWKQGRLLNSLSEMDERTAEREMKTWHKKNQR